MYLGTGVCVSNIGLLKISGFKTLTPRTNGILVYFFDNTFLQIISVKRLDHVQQNSYKLDFSKERLMKGMGA